MARRRLIRDLVTRGRNVGYGPHRSQSADLRMPRGDGPYPVMVAIHGGSWSSRYGKVVMRGLAGDLVLRGWAVWNIEYRRLGRDGGWPMTFQDVAAAINHLPFVPAPLDLERVSLLGHSAGGHLALWAASRARLEPDAPGAPVKDHGVRIRQVIAQAGVCDLSRAGSRGGRTATDPVGGAAAKLMGGAPEQVPERYDVGDPLRLVPAAMPVLLVHGTLDETVPVVHSRSYADAARAAGGEVEFVEIAGEAGRHRAHIDPRGEAWRAVTDRLPDARQ